MGGPNFFSARSTISIARSTPAQKPRGWANTTRIMGLSRIVRHMACHPWAGKKVRRSLLKPARETRLDVPLRPGRVGPARVRALETWRGSGRTCKGRSPLPGVQGKAPDFPARHGCGKAVTDSRHPSHTRV